MVWINIYFPIQKYGAVRLFFSYAHEGCLFDQKYCKNSNIVKYYYNLKELFLILTYFKM